MSGSENKGVSVIVLVWNGREHLPACLDALLAQDCADFEAIVVDNASTDGSADFVAENYPQLRLIRNRGNLGFAGGCNVGIRAAQGDVLVLLNPDTVVAPNWLRTLSDALGDRKVGVAGCKAFYPDGETIQHAGGWIEWPLGEARHYGQREQSTAEWDTPRVVEYVTGAAMAFRRDVLEKVGLLDEEFWPVYFEDTDFCLRAHKAGYEVWYIPEATLTHVETASHTDHLLTWQSYHRGRLRFLLKHMPPDQLLSQFVRAEESHQDALISVFGSRPLCHAYLEAASRAASLLHSCWQAEQATVDEVVRALQRLHASAWEKGRQRIEASMETTIAVPRPPAQPDGTNAFPHLREFEFQSDIPIIGPLVSRVRSLWYGVAARWSTRYLMQQQEEINQYYQRYIQYYQRYIQTLKEVMHQRLAELAAENALLAKEIAALRSPVYGDGGVGQAFAAKDTEPDRS